MKKAFVLCLFILLAAVTPSVAQQQGPGTYVTPGAVNKILSDLKKGLENGVQNMPRQAPYPGVHMPNPPQQDKQMQKNNPQQAPRKAAPSPQKQEQAKPAPRKKNTDAKISSTLARPVGEEDVNKLSADIKRAIFNDYQRAI